jgi:hypothetical protein
LPQRGRADHDRGHEGRRHQAAPELLHQQREVGMRSAEAAMLLRQGRGEPAEFRELRPDRVILGAKLGEHPFALLECVILLAEALEAFLQQPLLVGERRQHG